MARTELNTEYFSGSQASIFIGELWVDDIVDWQCSVGSNSMPIYGYGDTFWSHAAQGRIMVQGSFTINFREPNYLFAILEHYRKKNEGSYPFLEAKRFKEGLDKDGQSIKNPIGPYDFDSSYNDAITKRQMLEDFFNKKKKDSDGKEQTIKGRLDSLLPNSTVTSDQSGAYNPFAIPAFNIKIGYGSVINEDTIGEQIIDVKLVGRGRLISANGEALKESYSFFAKNLI